jgi:uncharacterized membrane protein
MTQDSDHESSARQEFAHPLAPRDTGGAIDRLADGSRWTSAAMTPRSRRVLQALLYEGIAVAAIAPALSVIFQQPMSSTIGLSIFMSTVALVWNYVFNGWFERWEARQLDKQRTLARRLAHGIGFEGGLVILLVPAMAWWLETSIWNALVADLGILAFFFVYTVVFTWAFDRVFGLPEHSGK